MHFRRFNCSWSLPRGWYGGGVTANPYSKLREAQALNTLLSLLLIHWMKKNVRELYSKTVRLFTKTSKMVRSLVAQILGFCRDSPRFLSKCIKWPSRHRLHKYHCQDRSLLVNANLIPDMWGSETGKFTIHFRSYLLFMAILIREKDPVDLNIKKFNFFYFKGLSSTDCGLISGGKNFSKKNGTGSRL